MSEQHQKDRRKATLQSIALAIAIGTHVAAMVIILLLFGIGAMLIYFGGTLAVISWMTVLQEKREDAR